MLLTEKQIREKPELYKGVPLPTQSDIVRLFYWGFPNKDGPDARAGAIIFTNMKNDDGDKLYEFYGKDYQE